MTGSRTPGERITFDLSTFKSVVTRQMLVLRMRRQPVAMGVSVDEELPAALVDDGRVLAVDAAALAAMNGAVRRDLEADLGGAIRMLRRLEAAQTRLDACAVAFSRIVYRMRSLPPAAALRDYVEAVADYQALGGVRFCLPPNLRSRLGEGLGDAEAVDALLGPQSSTLWAGIRMRELALARHRASPRHHRLAESFRRGYGYLGAEDVDFRAAEAPEAIAARIAALASKGDLALAQEASRLGIDAPPPPRPSPAPWPRGARQPSWSPWSCSPAPWRRTRISIGAARCVSCATCGISAISPARTWKAPGSRISPRRAAAASDGVGFPCHPVTVSVRRLSLAFDGLGGP
jgi:hypothetical protein